MKGLFFKNIHDSKLVDVWFNSVRNSLWTSAGMVVAVSSNNVIAWAFTIISYLFLATQVTHGTREPYEHLKKIYIYDNDGKVSKFVFDFFLFNLRLMLMFIPIALVWWAKATGKVPI
ncbi:MULTISPECIES: hypothetical protein [Vibrionaceae]|uniref:Uncharacterized protein n=1 Tax=Enterovibrio nigricans DSM 22720 TaxID=1121868 RepID=A0A1T4UY68_9GAMM|nr:MULTISPECIES: hypothetical protein [Vibrionaceae]PKF50763.1 hypothetical protein AT251_08840 [Enterovibrio nigricans]SKA57578.1 hypothetical protein SAMN02745132_02778 [Enterovibrio nigricans DSM 22720]